MMPPRAAAAAAGPPAALVAFALIAVALRLAVLPHVLPEVADHHEEDDKKRSPRWALYGSSLSPFALKVEATLATLTRRGTWTWTFKQGWMGFLAAEVAVALLSVTARGGGVGRLLLAWIMENPPSDLGELPLVPYVFPGDLSLLDVAWNGGRLRNAHRAMYDSTYIVNLLLREHGQEIPPQDASLAFLIQLLDEFFDEWGLYLVHHRRWVDVGNHDPPLARPGQTLAYTELFRGCLPRPLANVVAEWFNHRQTRRLAYLFSVAPENQPPRAEGYPPPPTGNGRHPAEGGGGTPWPETWALLDESWANVLDALEPVFSSRGTLLGGTSLNLADYALFGQLDMLARRDQGSRAAMVARAPHTVKHLDHVRAGRGQEVHPQAQLNNNVALAHHADLRPLVREVREVFLPLMRQNHAAYLAARARGESVFNEEAFWKGKALYDGQLRGHPFRSVVKTFQVEVWTRLVHEYAGLAPHHKLVLEREYGLVEADFTLH